MTKNTDVSAREALKGDDVLPTLVPLEYIRHLDRGDRIRRPHHGPRGGVRRELDRREDG
jgi:hypothetical protein